MRPRINKTTKLPLRDKMINDLYRKLNYTLKQKKFNKMKIQMSLLT